MWVEEWSCDALQCYIVGERIDYRAEKLSLSTYYPKLVAPLSLPQLSFVALTQSQS